MQQLTKINVYPGTPNLGYYKPLEQGQVKTKWLLPYESNIILLWQYAIDYNKIIKINDKGKNNQKQCILSFSSKFEN